MEQQQLLISSKTENLVLVEKLINEVCQEHKIKEDFYGNILIALTEAVNNAILHGNKGNPGKNVSINYTSQPDSITFTIKDEGDGFNYDTLPDPTAPENIEKPNGRGVFLMRNLADKVEFLDNGRVVSLNFKTLVN
ncbi:MAG: ATP-binding protein [Bacteroidetes bacterium]|nr:ATP-binding protein [Bacteroidota bacterium]